MLDEDLRALERSAQDAPSRLRYAEALLRVGRTQDAIDALVLSLDDAAVRRRLGRLEAPHVLIEREPREVWRAPLGPVDGSTWQLHASPLGVVAGARRFFPVQTRPALDVLLLDAASGRERGRIPLDDEEVLGVFGHVLLVLRVLRDRDPRGKRRALTAYCVVTGERLWALEIDATHLGVGIRGIRLSLDGRVRELSWPLAERPPHEEPPSSEASLPPRAAQSNAHFELPSVFYAVNFPAAANQILARSRAGERLALWRLTFDAPVHGVAACGRRLYAVVGGEAVCLE